MDTFMENYGHAIIGVIVAAALIGIFMGILKIPFADMVKTFFCSLLG